MNMRKAEASVRTPPQAMKIFPIREVRSTLELSSLLVTPASSGESAAAIAWAGASADVIAGAGADAALAGSVRSTSLS
jgi:hypothetical protein